MTFRTPDTTLNNYTSVPTSDSEEEEEIEDFEESSDANIGQIISVKDGVAFVTALVKYK